MHRTVLTMAFFMALPGLVSTASADDHDWPQYRGIHRDGVSPEAGLLSSWPADGLAEIWRLPIGQGFSCLIVADGQVFTMLAEGEEDTFKEYAAAFDADTGKKRWQVELGDMFVDEFGNGPRSSPTISDGVAYAFGSYGHLLALQTTDGAILWEMDIPKQFATQTPRWGFSTSPLIEDGMLFIEAGGGEGKAFAALDKKTGQVLWTALDGGAGYGSPIAVSLDGQRQFVAVLNDKVVSLDAKGTKLWEHPWSEQTMTIAMPLFVAPDKFFISASGNGGTMMIQMDPQGEARSAKELWRNRSMKNHFSSSVVRDGYIYGFDNATLKCLAVPSGELAWARRGFGKGSLILADHRLLILSDRGRLVLAEASPSAFQEVSGFQALDGKCWTSPTLSHGRIFLRNHAEMACYQAR